MHARPEQHREEGGVGWRSEHVTVHQLPTALIEGAVRQLIGDAVVVRDVSPEDSGEDGGHDAGEQQHDGQRVDDGEPVHLLVLRTQESVPAAGPGALARNPGGGVAE